MASKYKIERTTPSVYLDVRGQPIQGFIVFIHLTEYDEFHEVRVPNLQEKTVTKACDDLVANRDKLAGIGNK